MIHVGMRAMLAPHAPAIADREFPDRPPDLLFFFARHLLNALVCVTKRIPRPGHDDETGWLQDRAYVYVILIAFFKSLDASIVLFIHKVIDINHFIV